MKASEIRKEARVSLKGKWEKAAYITLAFMAVSFVSGLLQSFIGEESPLYDIIDLALLIINIPLSFGLIISFIKLKRGEDVKAFDYLKEGFSRFKKAWEITLQTLLKLILPYICVFITGFPLLLIFVLSNIYLFIDAEAFGHYIDLSSIEQMSIIIPVLVVLFILSTIYATTKSLLYTLSYYISYDNPELSSKECILRSATQMKGNRGKYFLLELSFIGWAILAAFTFGIGMLWLTPYMQIATVCFYEHLINSKVENIEEVINTKE